MSIWIKTASAALHDTEPPVSGSLPENTFPRRLEQLALQPYIKQSQLDADGTQYHCFEIRPELATAWAPESDTTRLCEKLQLDTRTIADDLEREVLLSMLLAPLPFTYPSDAEFASSVRIRCHIVQAARKTSLDFNTSEAERPHDFWTYHEDTGFTILPGKSLIDALQKATQPEVSGKLYSFSCYRATEYVILLGIARELQSCNPPLYEKLRKQWESKAIMSGRFHDAFLLEYGSMEHPLPPKFYVPGDRVWFRNPDQASAEITGYEGSWVIYLGCGLFTNFWDYTRPYSLDAKCVEIYHWRNAIRPGNNGELAIDEDKVARLVADTMQNPQEVADILQQMMRYRDVRDVFADGGCIDTTREYPRCVCPGTSAMTF